MDKKQIEDKVRGLVINLIDELGDKYDRKELIKELNRLLDAKMSGLIDVRFTSCSVSDLLTSLEILEEQEKNAYLEIQARKEEKERLALEQANRIAKRIALDEQRIAEQEKVNKRLKREEKERREKRNTQFDITKESDEIASIEESDCDTIKIEELEVVYTDKENKDEEKTVSDTNKKRTSKGKRRRASKGS